MPDATFARCFADWPDDPLCEAMSDNSCRWLNHILWLKASKERRACLPRKYNPAYFARLIHEDIDAVDRYLLEMTRIGLITFTDDLRIVVCGVQKKNPRLHWKDEEPEVHINPWVKYAPDFVWSPLEMDSLPVATPQPTPSLPLGVSKEKERREKREEEKERGERGETADAVIPPNKTQLLTTLLDDWNATAKAADFRTARTIGKGTRRAAMSARLDDADWIESYPAALKRIEGSKFCKGKPDWTWKANIDWFIRPDTVTKILEGTYDNPPKPKGTHTHDEMPF